MKFIVLSVFPYTFAQWPNCCVINVKSALITRRLTIVFVKTYQTNDWSEILIILTL